MDGKITPQRVSGDHQVSFEEAWLDGYIALTGTIDGETRTYYCSEHNFLLVNKPDAWFTVDDMFVRLHNRSKR